jgi:site-specific recombinase XerD
MRIPFIGGFSQQVGKDLREIQEFLRHKNIRTTVRYTNVGYEQSRQAAEALSQALG